MRQFFTSTTVCRPFSAALLLLLLVPDATLAQDASTRVDELFSQWDTRTTAGAAVLVLRGGEPVHARGYGMANLEHDVPIDTRSVFDIASVSKQFAAMAIALLEADGRISLDDDVRKYIPELHDFGEVITIRHLVHHTSGIRDWPHTLSIAGWHMHDVKSFDQILRMAFAQRELNFAPGEEFEYSNTGYNLLAEVVRRVSGVSFREFTDQRIFQPLGMRDTHFRDNHMMVVPRRAESYLRTPDGSWLHIPNNLTAFGAGSLFSTVDDLGRWVANFSTAEVGGPALVERLHERGVLNRGDTITYAFGQMVGSYRGLPVVSHTGGWAGYRTVLQRFPEHDLAIIVLANTSNLSPSLLVQRIADIYLADVAAPVAVAKQSSPGAGAAVKADWTPSADELQQYAGTYTSSELMTTWLLHVRDGRLVASHFRIGDPTLQPLARDTFGGPLGEVRFVRDAAGRVTSFTANSSGARRMLFVKQN